MEVVYIRSNLHRLEGYTAGGSNSHGTYSYCCTTSASTPTYATEGAPHNQQREEGEAWPAQYAETSQMGRDNILQSHSRVTLKDSGEGKSSWWQKLRKYL